MISSDAPWADAPFTLIPTPGRGENVNKLDDTVWIAREMANAHNGMLRALNSIYQQCIYVKEAKDVKDLLLYARLWCDWIHEHHEGEETFLFARIEEITGVERLMEVNVAQHHTFMNGLEELQKYAKEIKAEEYDGMKLRSIIDSFGGNLTKHLTEEIETLLGLKKYDGPALRKAFVGFDDEMRKGDKSTLFPIVLGSSDVNYEGGLDWPEVPGPIKALVYYWFERKYKGAWRFCPSTTWGERRQLLFTGKAD
ncbi:hypothetical protein NA56DRAFT_197819 [Hyaloscypha hepaticicola]|uniref:Hemerythrin-like domain-containing protein n=1 Tax=Hyaloscypha hepaticicola TaxID=2082293 RepID=A0A2J6Q0B3_9HELO|nr:hypothetical protein NA56DRAFT_197819 [Hyaloscypha hepaticicola]